MKKIWHVAMSHIKDRLGSVCFMMLELTVVAVLSVYFYTELVQFLEVERQYGQLSLSQIAKTQKEAVAQLPANTEIIDENRLPRQGYFQNDEVFLCPVSQQYFSYVRYKLAEGAFPNETNSSVLQGVFSESMKDSFSVGQVYSITLEGSSKKQVQVKMVGRLETDYLYVPCRNEVRLSENTVLVYDVADQIKEESLDTVTVWLKDPSALTEEQHTLLFWAEESRTVFNAIHRRDMGVPMVMTILLFVLGIAMFAGYNFMQMLQREKYYGVYYLCGASWKDCIRIQLIVDCFTTGLPFCITAFLLYGYDKLQTGFFDRPLFTWTGIGIVFCICFLIFILTSLEGILRLRKKSPTAIIERWNQT